MHRHHLIGIAVVALLATVACQAPAEIWEAKVTLQPLQPETGEGRAVFQDEGDHANISFERPIPQELELAVYGEACADDPSLLVEEQPLRLLGHFTLNEDGGTTLYFEPFPNGYGAIVGQTLVIRDQKTASPLAYGVIRDTWDPVRGR